MAGFEPQWCLRRRWQERRQGHQPRHSLCSLRGFGHHLVCDLRSAGDVNNHPGRHIDLDHRCVCHFDNSDVDFHRLRNHEFVNDNVVSRFNVFDYVVNVVNDSLDVADGVDDITNVINDAIVADFITVICSGTVELNIELDDGTGINCVDNVDLAEGCA